MSVNKRRWLRGKQIYKLTSQPHLFEIGTSIDNKLQICQSLILDGAGQVVLVRWNLQGPQRRPLFRLNFQFHNFLIISHRDNRWWGKLNVDSVTQKVTLQLLDLALERWQNKKVLFNEKFPGRYRIWFGGKKTGMWLCVKKSGSFVEWKLFQKKGNVVLWWSWGSFVDQPVRVTTEELPSHQTLHQLMKPFWKICQNKNILNVNNEIVLHPWDNLRNFPSGASFIEARPKKLERDCDCSLLHTCYSLHCCPQVLLSLILENLFPLVDCLLLFLPWADFILEKLQHPCYIPF